MSLKPSRYLFFPIKDGEWLRDSQGKPRVYKSPQSAYRNLERHAYDSIHVYAVADVMSRSEFVELLEGGKYND